MDIPTPNQAPTPAAVLRGVYPAMSSQKATDEQTGGGYRPPLPAVDRTPSVTPWSQQPGGQMPQDPFPARKKPSPYAPGSLHTKINGEKPTSRYQKFFLIFIMLRYGTRAVVEWIDHFLELRGKKIPRSTLTVAQDITNGLLSMAITGWHASSVLSNIKKVFAETVALETGKAPEDITLNDLRRSDNKLVRRTFKNFISFNAMRVFTDSVFFVRPFGGALNKLSDNHAINALKQTPGTDLGMFAKGGLLAAELYRPATFFETVVNLTDDKLSTRGLGDSIVKSDLADLYQRYAEDLAPQTAFKGVSDNARWGRSEVIFERMAYLMDQTYRHKNSLLPHGERAEFPMPKFLYLLGHGMIQPDHVPETLAIIEIANQRSVLAAKRATEDLQSGMPLETVLEAWDITLPEAREIHQEYALQAGEGGYIDPARVGAEEPAPISPSRPMPRPVVRQAQPAADQRAILSPSSA